MTALTTYRVQDHTDAILILVALAISFAAFLDTGNTKQMVRLNESLRLNFLANTLVIVPIDRWSAVTKKVINTALLLRGQVRVLQIAEDGCRLEIEAHWQENVVSPLLEGGRAVPELVLLDTQVFSPMAEYILAAERERADRQIIVMIAELSVRHWWQKPLHNNRNRLLKLMLSARGGQRIIVIDVPWAL